MMKYIGILCLGLSLFVSGCSNQPCRIEDRTDVAMTGNEKVSSSKKDLTKRVFVYKADGSLQCGMGTKIDVQAMRKELGNIEIFSAENKHDGMMRIQVCGQPTGFSNVYEIDEKDLPAAVKLGFNKWIGD